MNTKEDFAQYPIFKLGQLLWNYYSNILNILAWEKNVPPIYFYYIKCCAEICLEKWSNKLPNFYFLWDRIEKQVELFMPGFSTNEEDFMELLYGVRRVQKNILKKTKKKYVIACFFFVFCFAVCLVVIVIQ